MKAVLLDAPGLPSALRLGEVKDPVPSTGEVLVRVHAAALNPFDFKVAAIGSELWHYPHVLGVDAAGDSLCRPHGLQCTLPAAKLSGGEIAVLPCSTKVPEECGSSPFPRRDPSILPER